ncbi:MAG TPA: FAD-dependent oxidoreductase [Candidatus Obscuribacterales bacterium]
MTRKQRHKFLIVGGGPTGMGAAWRLNELGQKDWLLLERSDHPGGLASSVVDEKGFVWDLGGHVLFSHYDYFDEVLDRCLGEEWVHHQREAWVWLRGQFIPYPIQNNIWRLPAQDLVPCLEGLLSVHNKSALPLRTDSFEDWILRHFGNGLADVFFLPYNYKVWAYPPRSLSACWMQERVATVDLTRILRNLVLRQDDLGWGPNSKFRFPLYGGTGTIWKRVAENLPKERMIFGRAIVEVNPDKKQVKLNDGSVIEYEFLLSSMPLTALLSALSGAPELKKYTHKFLYSSTNLVGLGMEGAPPPILQTKCWMYFVENQFPFYRITVFSNYSKHNVPRPGEQWSLLCEISESPAKKVEHGRLQDDTVNALKGIGLLSEDEKIVSVWQKRIEFGYPTPFLERDEVLNPINEKLVAMDIFSRGRFGAWKYEVSNQDHSFMQGVETIDHILFGTEEITYHHPSVVNSGKRKMRRVPAM